mmetsp:Transcript_29313/g.84816  ORF Transcript_29313/g.84816 Transcript_29313/m.84816 type:complete len:234 (+) Transcript_29313:1737-2438(+)
MLQQTADVVSAHLAQLDVLSVFVEEERLAVLPEGLVDVHAGAVVAEDGLGHEGGRLAVLPRHVLDDVLVRHQHVRTLYHRPARETQLTLARSDFVVVFLDGDAHVAHCEEHLASEVHGRVDGRHGEVPVLGRHTVGQVGATLLRSGVPVSLDAVDLEEHLIVAHAVLDVVKDEKLSLRTDDDRVGDALLLDELEAPGGHRPRVPRKALVGLGVLDRTCHVQRLAVAKRVDPAR